VAALRGLPFVRSKALLNDENYGLGGSHKVAFDYALANDFQYCVVLHGDDQGCIADLVPLVQSGAHRKSDCLLGARFMSGSQLVGYSTLRTIGNRFFNLIYSLAAGVRLYDLGSGLNLYATSALSDRVYLRHSDDLTFNYYLILSLVAMGRRIRFFPISWRETDQVSNVKLVRQSLRVLAIACQYMLLRRQFLGSNRSKRLGPYTASVVFDSAAEVT
jgi:glycosyltransferase involved in cell wall biosynthesis